MVNGKLLHNVLMLKRRQAVKNFKTLGFYF